MHLFERFYLYQGNAENLRTIVLKNMLFHYIENFRKSEFWVWNFPLDGVEWLFCKASKSSWGTFFIREEDI